MDSPPKESLIFYLKLNQHVIDMQLDGITHAESLMQPPFRGNCMNWVLGHILTGRDSMLKELGLPGELSPEQYRRYDRDSEPIVDPQQATELEELRAMSKRSCQRLILAIEAMGMDTLNAELTDHKNRSLGSVLAFSQWHEAYHAGQLEQLRQLSGKDDKVI
jgi:hypothetical protein